MATLQAATDLSLWSQKKQRWQLHSDFKATFNLVNPENKKLLLLASEEIGIAPGGIFLKEEDFKNLHSQVKAIEAIESQGTILNIITKSERFQIELVKNISTKLEVNTESLVGAQIFLEFLKKNSEETGFDIPLKEFAGNSAWNKFQLQGAPILENKAEVVDYLIGRGRGLTPSGDDFIIGWLLVEELQGRNNIKKLLQQKISLLSQLTTVISCHYLKLAASGYFSLHQLELSDFLLGKINCVELPKILTQISAHGHTSGNDFLAGVATALQN